MSEKIYDEQIAPKLLELAAICKENKIPFIATCEYEPDSLGSTFAWLDFEKGQGSVAMLMNYVSVMAKGNVDNFAINLLKWSKKLNIDYTQTLFLKRFTVNSQFSR